MRFNSSYVEIFNGPNSELIAKLFFSVKGFDTAQIFLKRKRNPCVNFNISVL